MISCKYKFADNICEIKRIEKINSCITLDSRCIGEAKCVMYEEYLECEIKDNNDLDSNTYNNKTYINQEYDALKPSHYNSGDFDVIAFCLKNNIDFCRGNIIKYVVRAGKKDKSKEIEDLEKAIEYIERIIEYLRGE